MLRQIAAQAAAGRSGGVAIGVTQEYQDMFGRRSGIGRKASVVLRTARRYEGQGLAGISRIFEHIRRIPVLPLPHADQQIGSAPGRITWTGFRHAQALSRGLNLAGGAAPAVGRGIIVQGVTVAGLGWAGSSGGPRIRA